MLCGKSIQFPSSRLPFACSRDNRQLGITTSWIQRSAGAEARAPHPPHTCTGDALGVMHSGDAMEGCCGGKALGGALGGMLWRGCSREMLAGRMSSEDALWGCSRARAGTCRGGGRCRARSEAAAGRGTLPLSAVAPGGAGEPGVEDEGRPPMRQRRVGGRRAPVP